MPSDTQPHPDQRGVEPLPERPRNIAGEVDYVPHPEKSIPISPSRTAIQQSIINLYSGSASEKDMDVHKIAGQWYGIPTLFAKPETLATEATSSTPNKLVRKQRQQYTFSGIHASKAADNLISLKLEGQKPNEKAVYHKNT
ncbi:hypothetical protein DL766_001175 [Monosporascus sp. MC13-8B]|uniref:Uncharacterized protein n=1 Tax=Monosporascus cannonballus TaxID=155416 RepID=A0ABY0HFP2_9PEZI|nr:hypothetical protein DL762_002692 [Monosporascus cannonballus]RYO97676.1 hypothetical protein DL763_002653 [Monosporascus cannonballus]RYP38096.1 hypothetical protein DL766_001175 [Monosporascus sp. MC13-8B]